MDNYPERLAPKVNRHGHKESFVGWWGRVHASFQAVPRNVARQWIYRHWRKSEFGWLKASEYQFELKKWTAEQILNIQIDGSTHAHYRDDWAAFQVSQAMRLKGRLPALPNIMFRRDTWPTPPIVLATEGRTGNRNLDRLPVGYVLVEGNRRLSFALLILEQGRFRGNHPIWVMRRCGHCGDTIRNQPSGT